MTDKSVILVHDYYNYGLAGVKEAVSELERELGFPLVKILIGDGQSVSIIKT